MLYDTHCHLNHHQFENDLEEVLARMRDSGVARCLVVGYDLPSSQLAVDLSLTHENIYAAVGIHPHEADSYDEKSERALLKLMESPKIVGVGEIGLDYHYNFSSQKNQMKALSAQLEIAISYSKPVIFHCREAYEPLLDILEPNPVPGVMHCWAGDIKQAEKALNMGLYLGFGGMITFKKAEMICAVCAMTPMKSILLETDAPYLAPTPHRGKRNEPAYVRLVAERVAVIKGMPTDAVIESAWVNANKLFHAK